MNTWINQIIMGANLFLHLSTVFVPVGIIAMFHNKQLNPMRFVLSEVFGLYLCCLFSLTFLPLPTAEEAAELVYRYQLIPFYGIIDIAVKPCASAVLGMLFNIAMTIPFGMFLRYYFGFSAKRVLLAAAALSLLIEIGQLTGLFFLFHGSYRLFDVDDLITNALGGFLGCCIVMAVERKVPALDTFRIAIHNGKHGLEMKL